MTSFDRVKGLRCGAALIAAGLLAAGCSKHGETARAIDRVDEALTANAPAAESPANRRVTADCREWRKLMGRKDFDTRYYRFGCINSATLSVSVSNRRDLKGRRSLKPSAGWEAVQTNTLDRDGKLDPGQVDTSKSSTTSNSN